MRFKKIATQILQLIVLGFIMTGLTGCTDNYDAPSDEARNKYYAADSTESALLSQIDLKRWIDNGYKTDNGKKVVIIDATHSAPSRYIPGAVRLPVIAGLGGWGMGRSDGPVLNVGNQVLDGPTIDAGLQYAGIDLDTVIVITSDGWATVNLGQQGIRAWWVFYYWGFSKANLKLLDGGNQGFSGEFGADAMVTSARVPAPSKFSVRDLPGNRIDQARAAFGDVFKGAANGSFERHEQIIINTLGYNASSPNGNCFGGSNGAKPCYNGSNAFAGHIRGAILLETSPNTAIFGTQKTGTYSSYYVFKRLDDPNPVKIIDYNTGEDIIADHPDKNMRIIAHCGQGQSSTLAWFYIANILGYNNAGMYDGSNSEWLNLPAFRYDNASTPHPAYVTTAPVATRSYVKWDFSENLFRDAKDGSIANRIVRFYTGPFYAGQSIEWDTTRYSDYVSFPIAPSPALAVDSSYKGDAREINEADKAYQKSKPGESGAFDGTGGSGGVAGC